jgi:hypothetical protein
MAIEHSIVAQKYLLFRATGTVTGSEIIAINHWLYSELADQELARFQLWDFSAAAGIEVDIEKLREVARQDKQAAKSAPLVIACVSPTDLVYGLSRMWQLLSDDTAIAANVFRDLPNAQAWMHAQLTSEGSALRDA